MKTVLLLPPGQFWKLLLVLVGLVVVPAILVPSFLKMKEQARIKAAEQAKDRDRAKAEKSAKEFVEAQKRDVEFYKVDRSAPQFRIQRQGDDKR